MEFVHRPYQPGETIAAIATPLGEGGVAIIRIAGNKALAVADRLFSRSLYTMKSHTVHYGKLRDCEGRYIDDVLVIPFLGKSSFAGEDTVEIQCHGGALIARRVLDAVIKAGARAASPGEFAFKAFINGKIDLVQAEAIQQLISAKSEKAVDAAGCQLQGALSQKVGSFQKELTDIAAIIEAWIDFPEEGLEFTSFQQLNEKLIALCCRIDQLISTFHDGKIIDEGISLCLIGAPNVGKSSLMNALLDKDRAIVSPQPGTTRDLIEDNLRLNGLNFKLIDTAGIRQACDIVEQEGIRRTRQAMSLADLTLLLLDATRQLESEEIALLQEISPNKTIILWNKIDASKPTLPRLDFPHIIKISAKEKIGLEQLHKEIDTIVWKEGPPSLEEVLITNVRHKEALLHAHEACCRVVKGLKNAISPEFLSIDLRHGLQHLGKIIGSDVTDDVLTAIFSQFCIGK